MESETVTLILVNLASIMQRADESLLPGVYKEVGAELHADPTGLGLLTLFRSIVQSACYPLAAYLAVRHNRAHVIALGAFLWAAATFLVGFSSTFLQVAISRGLNGIGLAIVIPAIQSLVADSTDESNRGMAFGWLQLTGNIGSILGGLFSVLIASTSFMGIAGWRIAFHLVGLISVVVGILVRLFANDPNFSSKDDKTEQAATQMSYKSEVKALVKEAKYVMGIPSFQIIVAQGIAGSFPWSGWSFVPMWLELIGFSHEKTAFLMTVYVVANSLGGLFGGELGDVLAKSLPNAGRIILSQISAGSAIPLAALLFLGLPDEPSTAIVHGLVLFIVRFCTSWNAPATNNPIFAEIVPVRSRTSIYALDQSFESVLTSFGPPVVGMLAQHVYGFNPPPKGSSKSTETEIDRENAASLAKAIYTATGVPLFICVVIYSFLYCTYPRDRDRAKMHALIESEMQQLEADDSLSRREDHTTAELISEKERSVIEVRYEEHGDHIELDDNDEKSLLHMTDIRL